MQSSSIPRPLKMVDARGNDVIGANNGGRRRIKTRCRPLIYEKPS